MATKRKTTTAEDVKKDRVRKAHAELAAALRDLAPEGSFAEWEEELLELTDEVRKEATQGKLQALADQLGDEVKVKGKTYKRHQSGTVKYYGLSGCMLVTRSTYREVGVRNGPTIVPLELVAGLAERATPALAKNIAHGYARHDIRTHCDVLREAYCSPPPRATAERIAKALAHDAHQAVATVEKLAFGRESVPEEARGVTLGFDRTSVPMAEEPPPGTEKSAPERSKPYVRAKPAPMQVNWRMAYIGTVCLVDKDGEAIKTYRYAGTAADDPQELIERMGWQLASLLEQAPRLNVGIVQDGAPEMWSAMRGLLQRLRSRGLLTDWQEAIDLPHVVQRLGEAFKLTHTDASDSVEYWKKALIESDNSIDTIEAILERGLGSLPGEAQAILQEHLTYIENNKDRMRYARLRRLGLPIGSGVTESTAKNVVNMRTKRSGQRWSIAGLRGVLTLRALLKSDRLARFWTVMSRRYELTVSTLAAAA
jgi:hypothetical protein